jgi:hypothetical protein
MLPGGDPYGYHVKSATLIYEDPQAHDEFWR